MKLHPPKASWFVSSLLVVILASACLDLVLAQPKNENPIQALETNEATFEFLGEHKLVNIRNIAYTSDHDGVFDIFFACSSARGDDPLRLRDTKDITKARLYFNDQKRSAKHFVRINNYCISLRNVACIESRDDSILVIFNARVADAFVQLSLTGADAENFRQKWREF